MKRIGIVAIIFALSFAGIAAAQSAYKGFLSSQYQLDVGTPATQPTVVTQGMPLTGPNKEPLKALQVTIVDYNDGGADHEFIWLADAKVWLWKASTKYPDGGAGWNRAPQYDFSVDAGTSAGAPIQASKTHGMTTIFGSTTLPLPTAGAGDRIYIQTSALLGNDAGTPRHTVLIEGAY